MFTNNLKRNKTYHFILPSVGGIVEGGIVDGAVDKAQTRFETFMIYIPTP